MEYSHCLLYDCPDKTFVSGSRDSSHTSVVPVVLPYFRKCIIAVPICHNKPWSMPYVFFSNIYTHTLERPMTCQCVLLFKQNPNHLAGPPAYTVIDDPKHCKYVDQSTNDKLITESFAAENDQL